MDSATQRLQIAQKLGNDPRAWVAMTHAVWAMEAACTWLFNNFDEALVNHVFQLVEAMAALRDMKSSTYDLFNKTVKVITAMKVENPETLTAFLNTIWSLFCAAPSSSKKRMTMCVLVLIVCQVLAYAAPHELQREQCATAAAIVRTGIERAGSEYKELVRELASCNLVTLVRLGIAHFVFPPALERHMFDDEPLARRAKLLAGIAVSAMYAHRTRQHDTRFFNMHEEQLLCDMSYWFSVFMQRMEQDARFATAFVKRANARASDFEVSFTIPHCKQQQARAARHATPHPSSIAEATG